MLHFLMKSIYYCKFWKNNFKFLVIYIIFVRFCWDINVGQNLEPPSLFLFLWFWFGAARFLEAGHWIRKSFLKNCPPIGYVKHDRIVVVISTFYIFHNDLLRTGDHLTNCIFMIQNTLQTTNALIAPQLYFFLHLWGVSLT